ncbi:MAG: DUF1385 domain-containing protein [Ruminococcaceae bacterium]|nr:DUF1385 domain-containing protein [Oscillospiraceae bacterium]
MSKEKFKTSIGGQAVIEGIMMRGPEKTCLAVRLPDKTIHTETEATKKNPAGKIPFIRGAFAMIISLLNGYKQITRSSELAFPEEEQEPDKVDEFLKNKLGDKAGSAVGVVAGLLGTLLAVVLFVLLPTLATRGPSSLFVMASGLMAVCEGVIKLIVFIAYLFAVTRIKDIHRVFEYHGAEHKTIFCYEHGEELTVENVKKYSRFPPRCGTSFLFIVIILSIIISVFISWESTWLRVVIKLLLIPVIMGIAYEILKFSGAHDNFLCKALAAPGLLIQRLTAFEPEADQIEVAIAALKEVIPKDDEEAKW